MYSEADSVTAQATWLPSCRGFGLSVKIPTATIKIRLHVREFPEKIIKFLQIMQNDSRHSLNISII